MTSNPLRVADYLFVLKNQEYSFLMRDAGIVQVAYIFDRLQVIRHRLAYYPCPFDITSHDLFAYDGGLVEFIQDVFLNDLESNLLLRSPVRFDYSPGDAKDFHPAGCRRFLSLRVVLIFCGDVVATGRGTSRLVAGVTSLM
jgi:hypothetical protein